MVHGIKRFKEYFGAYSSRYVFIGGAACDVLLSNEGVEFRQTKDLDIVLIMENLDHEFAKQFYSFISAGGYSHINKNTGKED